MRLYAFNNTYMHGIHNGIQAFHAGVHLLRKYHGDFTTDTAKMVTEWADKHETIIVLNAGPSDSMMKLRRLLESKDNPFPWAYFREPDAENLLTSIAVVLPEHMYSKELEQLAKAEDTLMTSWAITTGISKFSHWEVEFTKFRLACSLAR